jgi:hypothetical protein
MFKIGSKPICPSCGERELDNSDGLCCNYCYDRYYNNEYDDDSIGECSCCGHLLYEYNDYIYVDTRWESDVLVCGSCAARECTECPECGETVFNEILTLDPETKEMICTCCFDRKYPDGITSEPAEHIIPNYSSPSETSYPVRNFRLNLPDTPSPHTAELTDLAAEATNTADLIQRVREIPGLQEELARWVDERENTTDQEVTIIAENSVWDRDLQDGLMDVLLVKKISRTKFISLVPYYKKGTHLTPEGKVAPRFEKVLRYVRCKEITIETKDVLCADGEIEPLEKLTISVLPHALHLVKP